MWIDIHNVLDTRIVGGRTGGWEPGSNGGWEEKREWEGGYQKGAGAGRNGKNFATLAQYFAIGKVRGGGAAMEGGGNRECRVWEAGCSDPPVPPYCIL